MAPRTPRSRAGRGQAAKRIVSTGISRDDSDDELGTDDLPWEWIYENDGLDPSPVAGTKRSRASNDNRIIGARMGSFECAIGDIVLLKAESSNEAWVAIICEFLEDEDEERSAQFMWFSTQQEIRNRDKKRTDFLPNELYITPSWDVNSLATINGKADVLSYDTFMRKFPSGKPPRNSKVFMCRRGCNTRTATYTDEFVWEDIYGGPDDIHELAEYLKANTKATRRRRTRKEDSLEPYVARGDDGSDVERTPKRQKNKEVTTPRSKQRTVTTPGSRKRIMVKKNLEFTPLGTRKLSPTQVQASPFQLARSRLHVASVPASLPCREDEFASVYSHLETAIVDGTGSCIYIAGTPGTGKTATVREVIARLENDVRTDELDDFIFVEINGMKITDPHQSYSLLWEALKGERVSQVQALDLLEREFSNPSPRRVPCVVLMDELDQLVTKNQSVMYNFFNWPALRHSRLIVLAVANTMDLPERTLSNKISSRLGLTRITFPGYGHQQLMKIIQSRLEGIPGDIVDPDAVQFASRKVAAVSGDARRALDICRRAVELAEAEAPDEPSTPSKKGRKPGQDGPATGRNAPGRVTIATIKRAINEATSNPIQQYLRALALSPRLLLIALLARMQRSGTNEATFGDILVELHRMLKMATGTAAFDIFESLQGPGRQGENYMIAESLAIQTSAVDLSGAGIIVLESQKAERPHKLRLAIGDEEVRMALRDDADIKALGISI